MLLLILYKMLSDQTGGNTGQRMALMRLIKDKMTGINLHEGIVTYNDPGAAMKAVKNLNGKHSERGV